MKNSREQTGGFIALISILILSAVLLATTISLAQFGIANRFFILNLEQKASSKKLAEACVQIARIKVYNDPSYAISATTSINIAGGTCTINRVAISNTDSTKTIIKTQSIDPNGNTVSNLCVAVSNTGATSGDFASWLEVKNFSNQPAQCP